MSRNSNSIDLTSVRPACSSLSRVSHSVKWLGDGLCDEWMQLLLRRTGLPDVEDLRGVSRRFRGGDVPLAAVFGRPVGRVEPSCLQIE